MHRLSNSSCCQKVYSTNGNAAGFISSLLPPNTWYNNKAPTNVKRFKNALWTKHNYLEGLDMLHAVSHQFLHNYCTTTVLIGLQFYRKIWSSTYKHRKSSSKKLPTDLLKQNTSSKWLIDCTNYINQCWTLPHAQRKLDSIYQQPPNSIGGVSTWRTSKHSTMQPLLQAQTTALVRLNKQIRLANKFTSPVR